MVREYSIHLTAQGSTYYWKRGNGGSKEVTIGHVVQNIIQSRFLFSRSGGEGESGRGEEREKVGVVRRGREWAW